MKTAVLAAAALALTAAAPTAVDAPSLNANQLGQSIRTAATMHFGHWDGSRRASFSAAWSRYRAAAARPNDRENVDLGAIRLVASLHNAHSWIDDPAFVATRRWRLPFVLRYVDGAWIATQSRSTEISDGAALRAVDGVPAERFFQSHRDLIFASSETEARTDFEEAIRRSDPDTHRPRLSFEDGREFTPAPMGDATPRVSFRWITTDRVGYIAIPAFDDDRYERDAMNALKHFISAEAIVVDVRGNEGGATPINLLELITDRTLPWWKETTTAQAPARPPATDQHIPPADGHYRGRVVIIADERCAAACEDFVMPLVASGRARLVGTPTYGSTGEPFVVQLPGGITLAVGSIHAALPDGKPFEGIGLAPTDPVPLRLADVRAHVDAQLDRAVAVAGGAK